jgi:hypothetical protein
VCLHTRIEGMEDGGPPVKNDECKGLCVWCVFFLVSALCPSLLVSRPPRTISIPLTHFNACCVSGLPLFMPLWVSAMCVCVPGASLFFCCVCYCAHHKASSNNRFLPHGRTQTHRRQEKGACGVANNHIKQGEKSREKGGRHLDEGMGEYRSV